MCVLFLSYQQKYREVELFDTHNHYDINNNSTYTSTGENRRLCCSRTNGLLITWLRFFDTRGEKQFLKVFRNHNMLITPPTFGTSRGVLDLNSSSLVETRKT